MSVPVGGADEPEHFLEHSEYNFAVNLISGNLTATITPATTAPRDWPRIMFRHNADMLSPRFDVGVPEMYLFNDTNDDGLFAMSEITYTAHMSSFYKVSWNATPVEFGNDSISGEYAWLKADAVIDLYREPEDVLPTIEGWAKATFWFRISEKPVARSNSYGAFTVLGMVDVRMNFTLELLKNVSASGVVAEQYLNAGGSTNMFLIREDVGLSSPQLTSVDSSEDERLFGSNFTHGLRKTLLPCQEVFFSKEDGTVQAHYRMCSEPFSRNETGLFQTPMNISYLTTGIGLYVHTAYFLTNSTKSVSHEMVVGIDEAGFSGRMRDWLKENLPEIMIVSGSIVVVVCVVLIVVLLRKHWGWGKRPSEDKPVQKKD